MRELSLHILDLAQNSVEAGAKNIVITVDENENGFFVFRIQDDGKGMSGELLRQIRDPFVTTRLTRKVGMGIPFIDMVSQQCGGRLEIKSDKGVGTTVTAYFAADNIDRPPLGDMAETLKVLLAGAPWLDLLFTYKNNDALFTFDTREIRAVLQNEADFSLPEVSSWIEVYLRQEIKRVHSGEEDL